MTFRSRVISAIAARLTIGAALYATFCATLWAAEPSAPTGEPISAAFLSQDAAHRKGPGPFKAFFELLLMGYREGLSPVDGPSCPFHPTCSGFARQAIRSHGLAAGILMTGDRLMRCNGSGHDRYLRTFPKGMLYDPPPP